MKMQITNATVAAAAAGDTTAADTIIAAMNPQVTKLVNKTCGQYHREDGMSEAAVAVWESILTFDPDNTAQFMTFAHGNVRRALMSFVSTNTPGPTVPERSAKRYASNMAAAGGDASRALKMLTESTLDRTETGSPAAFTAAHIALTDTKHVDRLTREGEEGELETVEISATIDVETTALNRVQTEQMLALCSTKESDIIVRTYGLNGHEPHTDAETATALGISRPRVVTIRKAALVRIATSNPTNKDTV